MTMAVPYFDYPTRYAGWTEDVLDAVREVGESDEFILKSRVAALETAVARRTGAAEAIAVASGTGALTVILTAMDIGPGDDVVTPAFSFISSASTVALRGARPVFADVDYDTAMLTVATVEAVRTTASRAVVPAYLFASSPDMPALRALADRHSMRLIEDSAVALGGQVAGRPAGRHGDAGVYSFFPGKPLGGIGDAGMIVTDDPELATTCRMLRNHGQDLNVRFLHHLVGFNSRMDEVTALFLLRRLPHLDQFLAERRRLARQYGALLREAAPVVLTPPGDLTGQSVYTYVVRAPQRDDLRSYLAGRGIETKVYYPRPLHLQPAFRHLGHGPGDFPVAERLSRECLALPLHPELPAGTVERVVEEIAGFYRQGA
ncbi:aminotransferase DegT/DnrJ/EryC1/StrS family protein [Micromonospora andamanensis]|nr:aminotransferase DegT/DnrJ/EryC1/StrS family protein [Micromonospora andamanensis]